jgi:hypothetical protein
LTHEIQPSDHDVPHSTTGDQTSRRRRGIVPWNCTKACISESSTVPLGLGWSRWREPSATPPDHSEASNAPSSDDNRLFQRGVHRGELGVELGAEPFTIAMIASEMPASIRPHSIGGCAGLVCASGGRSRLSRTRYRFAYPCARRCGMAASMARSAPPA